MYLNYEFRSRTTTFLLSLSFLFYSFRIHFGPIKRLTQLNVELGYRTEKGAKMIYGVSGFLSKEAKNYPEICVTNASKLRQN